MLQVTGLQVKTIGEKWTVERKRSDRGVSLREVEEEEEEEEKEKEEEEEEEEGVKEERENVWV